MKAGRKPICVAVLALGTVVATSGLSSAQAASSYVGVGIGQSNTRFDSADFAANNAAISETADKNKTAYKIFLGHDYTNNWAIEVGYADLGKPKYTWTTTGATLTDELKQSSWFVLGKGTLPISANFSVFGKIGAGWNKSEATWTGSIPGVGSANVTHSHTKTSAVYGLGVDYVLNQPVSFQLEYDDFGKFGDSSSTSVSTGRTKVDLWTVGVTFKF